MAMKPLAWTAATVALVAASPSKSYTVAPGTKSVAGLKSVDSCQWSWSGWSLVGFHQPPSAVGGGGAEGAVGTGWLGVGRAVDVTRRVIGAKRSVGCRLSPPAAACTLDHCSALALTQASPTTQKKVARGFSSLL